MKIGAYLFLLVCLFIAPQFIQAGSSFSGVVVKVIDGDSLLIKTSGKNREVRLWGIDCPEYTQPYANESRQLSRKLMLKKKVTVQVQGRDKYNRYVGIVLRNGNNINEELVEKGAAWVYRRYCKANICERWKQLEKKAKKKKIGLWQDKNAVAPWEWRHKNN